MLGRDVQNRRASSGPVAFQRYDRLAEADGNRTRLVEVLDHVGFEDRGATGRPAASNHNLHGETPPR